MLPSIHFRRLFDVVIACDIAIGLIFFCVIAFLGFDEDDAFAIMREMRLIAVLTVLSFIMRTVSIVSVTSDFVCAFI